MVCYITTAANLKEMRGVSPPFYLFSFNVEQDKLAAPISSVCEGLPASKLGGGAGGGVAIFSCERRL